MPGQQVTNQIVIIARRQAMQAPNPDLTLDEAVIALECGNFADMEFWHAVEYAATVLSALRDTGREVDDHELVQ